MNQPNPFASVPKSGGSYFSWQTALPGTICEGTIVSMDIHKGTFEDAVEAPRFLLRYADGTEQYLHCTQANLKNQIIDRGAEFQIGGYLKVTFAGLDGRVKLFTVEHTAPTGAPAPAPPAPPVPPTAPPAAPPVTPPAAGQPSPLA